jgi:hypothetical protein
MAVRFNPETGQLEPSRRGTSGVRCGVSTVHGPCVLPAGHLGHGPDTPDRHAGFFYSYGDLWWYERTRGGLDVDWLEPS